MEMTETRVTLTSSHQKLTSTMEKLRKLRYEQVEHIVVGNHEHSPVVRRIVGQAFLALLDELGSTRSNEQQRDAMLTDRLDTRQDYQAALIQQRNVASQIQEMINEIELTRLAIEIELTLARMLTHDCHSS